MSIFSTLIPIFLILVIVLIIGICVAIIPSIKRKQKRDKMNLDLFTDDSDKE